MLKRAAQWRACGFPQDRDGDRTFPAMSVSKALTTPYYIEEMIGKPFAAPAAADGTASSAVHVGRRANARVRLHIPARLVLLSGNQNCILEDISVSGAAIIPEGTLPSVGASAILTCEDVEAFGQVRWARYGRCGLMFDEPVPLAQVVSLRHLADSYEATERARHKERARAWVQGHSRIV